MPKNVILVSSEVAPFAKTGGLADVCGSLPLALKKLGFNVSVFMPYYRSVAEKTKAEPTGLEVTVPLGPHEIKGQILRTERDGLPVYFIRRDEFFDRNYLYGTPEGDYYDNLERFTFFSRAVLEALKARGFEPDIIHCNDWQTALIPVYLKDIYKNDLHFAETATVFTIHNIAYQGIFPAELFNITGLSPEFFSSTGLEYWGKISLLKGGLLYSDVLTTVSEAYSREIQTPEYGYGLEGVLTHRSDRLYGILNGVDYDEWDPQTDELIPATYSIKDLSGKAACKKELLKEFKLKVKPDTPVIGIITRLAAQKGLDILAEAMERLMELDLGMIILGSGDKMYQKLVEELAGIYPKKLSVRIAFDNRLAHLVEAGSDMLLMPSRYEPCGLNQIYSLKYGTIPIVRATGGLDDTVRDYNAGDGTGFKFRDYSSEALVGKVREAVELFEDKQAWEALQRRGMKENHSWESSARRYVEVYRQALKCLKVNHPKP